jgi:hypothetical protein
MQVIFPCCCARFTMKHQHCFICSCLCLSLSSVCVSRSNLLCPSFNLPPCSFFVLLCAFCLSVLSACFKCRSVCLCLSLFLFVYLYPSIAVKYSVSVSMTACFSSHSPFVFKSVQFQLNFFISSVIFLHDSVSYSLAISLPISQVCGSYFHVAEWRRDLRCFELPQTVSLPPCLFMSLCICLIVSRCN